MRIKIKNNLKFSRQRGISLIELMISIPLGLLVIFSVLKIFTANINGVNLQNSFARVQENGRMSIELMARDIRGADFRSAYDLGCTPSITNNLDTSDDDYDASLLPTNWQQRVTGEDNIAAATEIAGVYVKEETDTLTLRSYQSFPDVEITTAVDLNSADFKVFISDNDAISQGDILLISNCEDATLFSVSSIDSDSITHNTGTISIVGAVNNAIKKFTVAYDKNSQLIEIDPNVKTYFIGENSEGGYSLYRSDNGSAIELVRGVNDLQLMYGEDTSGTGSVDTFSKASDVSDMDNVLSVRLQLVSESGNSTSSNSLERTYTVTVNIRNRTLK